MEFLLGRMISNENLALPKCCFACLKIKLMEDKKYSETFTHINLLFFQFPGLTGQSDMQAYFSHGYCSEDKAKDPDYLTQAKRILFSFRIV